MTRDETRLLGSFGEAERVLAGVNSAVWAGGQQEVVTIKTQG